MRQRIDELSFTGQSITRVRDASGNRIKIAYRVHIQSAFYS